MLATPRLTAIADPAEARRVLVDDALRATGLVRDAGGPVVDVGSGGGSPGVPLAVTLRELRFTLLEAERRKCEFLREATAGLDNVDVVWGRAEEQPTDAFAVALAKALAKPPARRSIRSTSRESPTVSPRRSRTLGTVCSYSASSARPLRASRGGPGWRRSGRSPERSAGGGVRPPH